MVCVSGCFTRQCGFCDLSRQLIGGSTADWDLELRPLVRGCSWLGSLKSPVLDQFFLPVPAVGLGVCVLFSHHDSIPPLLVLASTGSGLSGSPPFGSWNVTYTMEMRSVHSASLHTLYGLE